MVFEVVSGLFTHSYYQAQTCLDNIVFELVLSTDTIIPYESCTVYTVIEKHLYMRDQ